MHADVLRGSNCTHVCPPLWQIVRKQRSLQCLWSVHSCKWTSDEGTRKRVPSEGKRKRYQTLNSVLRHSWEDNNVCKLVYLPASSSACQKTLIVLHWQASACFEVLFHNGIKCGTFQASFWSFLCPSPPSVLHVPPVGTGLSPGIDFTTLTAACSANTTDLQHS